MEPQLYISTKSPGSRTSGIRPPDSVLGSLRLQRAYLSASQVGRILGKHRETVYIFISIDGLPAIKDGRRWKVGPIQLADWLVARGYASAKQATTTHRNEAM